MVDDRDPGSTRTGVRWRRSLKSSSPPSLTTGAGPSFIDYRRAASFGARRDGIRSPGQSSKNRRARRVHALQCQVYDNRFDVVLVSVGAEADVTDSSTQTAPVPRED